MVFKRCCVVEPLAVMRLAKSKLFSTPILQELFVQTNHFLRSGPAGQEYWRSDAAQGFKSFVRCGEQYCAVR